MTSGSSSRSASSSSSSPVWSPCRTAMVVAGIESNDMARSAMDRADASCPGRGSHLDVAELRHHAQLVGDTPVLDYPSVFEAADVDDVGERLDSCRGMAREAPQVGAAAALAGPDLVTDRDHLVDGDMEVGKRPPQVLDGVLGALGPVASAAPLMLDRPRRDQLVGDLEVAPVEAFLDQTAIDCLVGGRHGSVPPCNSSEEYSDD